MKKVLIDFFCFFRANGEKLIGNTVEELVDIYMENSQFRPFSSSEEAAVTDEEIEKRAKYLSNFEEFAKIGIEPFIIGAKWMRTKMLRRSSGAAVTAEEMTQLKRIRSYFGEHDKTPFEHHSYSFLNELINRLSSVVAESPVKPIDEQKILDTLRYVGRFLRGVIDKVSPEAVENDKSSWDERFFRIYPHAKETLAKVEDALNEFVVESAECPAGEGKGK